MTEAKKAAMLLYLNDECKDDGYEIFSDEDFLTLYPPALGVKKEEIERAVRALNEEGYIDVRYAEGGTYCVSVLEKGRNYESQALCVKFGALRRVSPAFRYAFFGGACGALLASALAGIVRLMFG